MSVYYTPDSMADAEQTLAASHEFDFKLDMSTDQTYYVWPGSPDEDDFKESRERIPHKRLRVNKSGAHKTVKPVRRPLCHTLEPSIEDTDEEISCFASDFDAMDLEERMAITDDYLLSLQRAQSPVSPILHSPLIVDRSQLDEMSFTDRQQNVLLGGDLIKLVELPKRRTVIPREERERIWPESRARVEMVGEEVEEFFDAQEHQ